MFTFPVSHWSAPSASSTSGPADLADLLWWIDPSDSATVHADTAVYRVDDKSGNGYDLTQSSTPSKPAVAAAALNGRDVLRFDGADDFLSSAVSITRPYTVFQVLAVHSGNTGRSFSTFHSGFLDNPNWLLGPYGGGGGTLAHHVGAFVGAGLPVVYGTYYITAAVGTAAPSSEWWVNGTSRGVNATASLAPTQYVALGAGYGSGEFGKVDVAELIAYSRPLSNIELNQIGHYLADKWALSWTDL